MQKLITIILLSFLLIGCIEEEETCAEEDKIVQYTEIDTYHYTTMEPKLVCP